MKNRKIKTKQGIASFYMIAIATLILTITAASFATIIVSEINRTSNDDLSQSAYDAALAGVEDAKLAYSNYRKCIEAGKTTESTPVKDNQITCGEIIYWMNHKNCDMVGHIIGRLEENKSGEVLLSNSDTNGNTSNNMNQAYTCTEITTTNYDYRANLSDNNRARIVKVQFTNNVTAKDISAVKISWYSNGKESIKSYNFDNFDAEKGVVFKPISTIRTTIPPTIAVQMLQTSGSFTIGDFSQASGSTTDRATVYLVPTDNSQKAQVSQANQIGAYNANADKKANIITAEQMANTNNHSIVNKPFAVYCPSLENNHTEFACSATMYLPTPINGNRINDTFLFAVSLPYGEPDTDFSLEFCTKNKEDSCITATDSTGSSSNRDGIAAQKDVQITIDSTGRAADLYRRVETRLETTDTTFSYPFYAIQILGDYGSEASLKKDLTVTKEFN